jgi:glycine betaine catabolism A
MQENSDSSFVRASVPQPVYTLPGRYYTAPELYAAEQERIFARRWACVGRSEEVANPGDYVLVELAGESLIVVRDRAGKLHAHYNVCRHRGTRMCQVPSGRFGETIQCPYHAWTYSLDGRLVAARHMQETPGFDRSDWPLHSAAVAEWEGFVMLNIGAEPEPFEAAFASMIGRVSRWGTANLRRGARIDYDVAANWKLIVENYSECYHCPLIHPELAALSPWQSGRNDLSEGPFLGGYMQLAHESMTVDGMRRRPPLPGLLPDDLGRVWYYALFPNLLLSLHPDYVMAHTLWPKGPGQTRIVCEWFFDSTTLAKGDFDSSDAVEFWDKTNRQDWHVCELSQLGVSSRAYTPGPYANAEGLAWQFDREYLRAMGQGDESL